MCSTQLHAPWIASSGSKVAMVKQERWSERVRPAAWTRNSLQYASSLVMVSWLISQLVTVCQRSVATNQAGQPPFLTRRQLKSRTNLS